MRRISGDLECMVHLGDADEESHGIDAALGNEAGHASGSLGAIVHADDVDRIVRSFRQVRSRSIRDVRVHHGVIDLLGERLPATCIRRMSAGIDMLSRVPQDAPLPTPRNRVRNPRRDGRGPTMFAISGSRVVVAGTGLRSGQMAGPSRPQEGSCRVRGQLLVREGHRAWPSRATSRAPTDPTGRRECGHRVDKAVVRHMQRQGRQVAGARR